MLIGLIGQSRLMSGAAVWHVQLCVSKVKHHAQLISSECSHLLQMLRACKVWRVLFAWSTSAPYFNLLHETSDLP